MTKAPEATTSSNDTSSGDENDNKFLSFRLGREEYGVEILRVREIIGIIDVTPLPQTPDYIKGVINLRGKIIPVIELRAKFSLDSKEYNEETCIIVVEVSDGGEDRFQMGVIVDSVNEVIAIPREDIEAAPKFGAEVDTDFIMGIGKLTDRAVTLLNIDTVMCASDTIEMRGAVAAATTQEQSVAA